MLIPKEREANTITKKIKTSYHALAHTYLDTEAHTNIPSLRG